MATNWHGSGALVGDAGDKIPVAVRLSKYVSTQGRTGWRGTFSASVPLDPGAYALELDGAGRGDTIVSVTVSADARGVRISGTIVGNGPAPF